MLKVFISSTSEDLFSYRAAAREVVLDLGWQPVMMEHFGTDGSTPVLESCLEKIDQSDLILAIIGWRRGWVPEIRRGGDGKKSCTCLEIERALDSGKPVLILVARDTWPGRFWESEPEARSWVEDFRRHLDRLAVTFDWEDVVAGESEPLPVFRSKARQELLRHHQDIFANSSWRRIDSKAIKPGWADSDERIGSLSEALDEAYHRYEELTLLGEDTSAVREEILNLRRQLREGGRLQVGDFLGEGRFKLAGQIGRGGFANVWKAFDRKLRKVVAVKVLHGQFAEDRTSRERFFRGGRKMSELQHPCIVRVLEEELEDGGYYFFVMEYMDGGDLQSAVREKRIGPEAALAAVQKVGEALHFAHQNGAIHRDIKPGNILLDSKGWPKLADFDLVRAFDTTGGTRTGMLGTFLYAAPEAMSRPQEAGVAADVYSLAMTAIFCLHGADLPLEVVRETNFVETLPCRRAVQEVLRRATSWNPADRFDSVASFMSALEIGLSSSETSSIQAPRLRPAEVVDGDGGDATLFQRVRRSRTAEEMAQLVCRELQSALWSDVVVALIQDGISGRLINTQNRSDRLDSISSIAKIVASASEPIRVVLDSDRSPFASLPHEERNWLGRSGFRIISPILSRDGSLLGLLGVTRKRYGLPFLRRDFRLLAERADLMAFWLEVNGSLKSSPSEGLREPRHYRLEESEEQGASLAAKECVSCGALYPDYAVFCSVCSRRLDLAAVPYVLPGKLRFERRIATGGMGIIYRASDLALGRPVAVKTLRRVSPEDAMRLRREARTAAAVSHRNLAAVFGMETWQGVPMLILELMEGGTLAHRIKEMGSLGAKETIDLGIAIADALASLHAEDILHRDIKPSNIGYSRNDTPKLMDFGIARVTFDLRRDHFSGEGDVDSLIPPTSIWRQTPSSITMSKQLVGTLPYLAPEALAGEPATQSFDLWAFTVVLFECLSGQRVFSGNPKQVMAKIKQGDVPDIAQVIPEPYYNELFGSFFRSALNRDPGRRPSSAGEIKVLLEEIRTRLESLSSGQK